ncbi:MAG: radical SAM protein [Candidatus Omnitrophota bacterium]
MKFDYFFQAAKLLIKARFFKIKIPLAVSWSLTFRCNQRCLYCAIWKHDCREMVTPEVLSMMTEFIKLGTKWISFTGGEPLMRDDIGAIVQYAKNKNIYVSVSSNGRLVTRRINQLKGIDRIKLTLDGPAETNDIVRGAGSFDAVMEAIDACKKNGIPICLQCVLSKYNLDSVDWVIDFATTNKLKILFQPAVKELLWSMAPNVIAPSKEAYRRAIIQLIKRKQEGAPISNSLSGLRHLYCWPEPKKIYCSAGRLSFNIGPDGTILACNRLYRDLTGIKKDININDIIKGIKPVLSCDQCWCSSLVEFNLITSLNLKAIINYLRNC